MRYIRTLVAFIAVLAFSTLAVASASATLWLKNGSSLTREEAMDIHGLTLLHHTGGIAGSTTVHCTGLLHGTAGPGALDLVSFVLNLAGTETNTIECEFSEGGSCGTTKEKIKVTAVNLPWHTLLELMTNGVTLDHFLEETAKTWGVEWACPKIFGFKGKCEGLITADFLENGPSGSILNWLGEPETSASDGGKCTVLGSGETLGYAIS